MNWALSVVLCVFLLELALRLPFAGIVARASQSGSKALRVVRAKAVSDHWKEKALISYAQTTFRCSIQLAVLLAIVLAAAILLAIALEQFHVGFQSFLLGWRGICFSILVASLYVAMRRSVMHERL